MWTAMRIGTILSVLYAIGMGLLQPRLTERTVGRFQSRDIEIALPAHPSMVSMTFFKLAESSRVPLGVEMIPVPVTAPDIRVKYKPVESLVLSGKTLAGALDRLMEFQPDYTWSEDPTGIVNVLPRTRLSGGGILEQRVAQFEINGEGIVSAMVAGGGCPVRC